MKKGEGWALDTRQVEEEIQNKYFARISRYHDKFSDKDKSI